MSDHAWTQENLAAFVAGGLDAAEDERLERHAAECTECAAALHQARLLDRGLDTLFAAGRPGPALEDRMVQSLRTVSAAMSRLLPSLLRPDGGITIGPFPKGLPVNLLSNLQPLSESSNPIEKLRHVERMLQLLVDLKLYLVSVPKDATDEQMVSDIASKMGSALLALNKCPDFEVNRGHYFGTGLVAGEPALSDSDKRALIEFLKTF